MDSKRILIEKILKKLSNSPFRKRFVLGTNDIIYYNSKGYDVIKEHACHFVRERIAPEKIVNDGKQTPMKKHPVFIAQHATATCCRGCIEKWHGIEKNKQLNEDEINYIVDIIMLWILTRIKTCPN